MAYTGSWTIVMKTPMGDREAELTMTQDGDALSGTMTSEGQATEISNGKVADGKATWDVDVTSPMPLTLSFDMEADGADLTGNVKLGMFGNAPATGTAK